MADFEDANSPTWENVRRRAAERPRRGAAHDRARHRREELPPERRDGDAADSPARLASRRAASRGGRCADQRSLFDFGLVVFNNAREQLERGTGPYFYLPKLESHAGGAAVGAGVRARRGGARPAARLDQVHGADRDDPRRLRDGRDPLRAARPFVRANAGRWDYIFSCIKKMGARAARPRAGDDDGAVHARLLASCSCKTCHDARCARDRRHGGVHPLAPRRGGERDRAREGERGQAARGRRRLRRHVGRASRPRPGRAGGVRRGARRASEPGRPQARRRARERGGAARLRRSPAARSPTRACA